MQGRLEQLFNESINIFFTNEIDNIIDNVAERNLCGRLAIYMTSLLKKYRLDDYFADPEYNRKQGGRVKTVLDGDENIISIQCDLILHSRGRFIKNNNLIAIEMKKSYRPETEKISDRKRLRAMTKDSYDGIWSWNGEAHPEHVCGYLVGIYMIINNTERSYSLEYYQHGELIKQNTLFF